MSALIGIAGLDEMQRIQAAHTGLNITGEEPVKTSKRLGDQAAVSAWQRGAWFADYSYVVRRARSGVAWREGREGVFGPSRRLPLLLDSCGYRREISRTAPQWAHAFDRYLAAIEQVKPDGFAAWDYPLDRQRSLDYLRRMAGIFPGDERLWPVFSIRWTWRDDAPSWVQMPGWMGSKLVDWIPLTRTQRAYPDSRLELWARRAVANALLVASDPDFRWMAERFGRVMIGGMINGPCARAARHLFFAVLCKLFPTVQFWGLGQANYVVVNGLARFGLLDQVWLDGSWWIKDAAAERFALLEEGMLTVLSLETSRSERAKTGVARRSFFSIQELMAANLRSLLAAYQGLWAWPQVNLDSLDLATAQFLKPHFQEAAEQLTLFAESIP